MIVFKQDWKKYPQAIVDTKTSNKSFLRIVALFKEMGVDHYYFPLALLQPELQGVNPHSENLTLEQKVMILDEIDNNPWYYLREVVRDWGAGITDEDCQFKANRGNIAAMWLVLACIDFIMIQPRQTGKSFTIDTISEWLMYFCYRDTQMNLITKDETLRKGNIARLKKLRDGWPDYANRNTKKDDNNQISLSCNELNNKYYTHVSQSSEKAANNLGRGMTSPFIHIDEGPFINHIETTVAAAMGATSAARDIAKRKGVPFCTIFTTTAGDQEDRDGRYVFGLYSGAAIWTERFYDCTNRDELDELVKTNGSGRSGMVNLTMSHRQLGLSDDWLYEAIARSRTESDNVDRDYFNQWTSSSGELSIIPQHVAKEIRSNEMDPIDQWISKENYILRWYEDWDPNAHYIITLDTSDAIGRDDIGLTILNVKDGGVVAAGDYNETNLVRFSNWVLELMITYRNTTLIIEQAYNAQHIVDNLLLKLPQHGEDPFKRIYNKLVQDKSTRPKEYNHAISSGLNRPKNVYDLYRRDFGFKPTNETRTHLYSTVIMNAAHEAGTLMRDKKLIQQTLSLRQRNGRIDHSSSGHDDMVISWLMGHWLLNYGVNLDAYGIRSGDVMSERKSRKGQATPQEQHYEQQQRQLEKDVEVIHEQLKEAQEPAAIRRLEGELSMKMTKLDRNESSSTTLDGMIKEAEQAREQNRMTRSSAGPSKTQALLQRFGGR